MSHLVLSVVSSPVLDMLTGMNKVHLDHTAIRLASLVLTSFLPGRTALDRVHWNLAYDLTSAVTILRLMAHHMVYSTFSLNFVLALIWGLSWWLTTLLRCFDTVGWVIRPVKTVGRITYIVLVQTCSINQSISLWSALFIIVSDVVNVQ